MNEERALSIFMVDDEALIVDLVSRHVEAAGHKMCATANNLADGLALVDAISGEIDVAILDLNLGGVMSTPIAQKLRRFGVPFLVLTGYSEADMSAEGIDAPVLSKPFRTKALLDMLNALARQ